MWEVKFKFKDLQNEVVNCSQEFESKKEAEIFYNHITDMTYKMLKKYGKLGIYHPYYDIKIKEIK